MTEILDRRILVQEKFRQKKNVSLESLKSTTLVHLVYECLKKTTYYKPHARIRRTYS